MILKRADRFTELIVCVRLSVWLYGSFPFSFEIGI